MIYTIDKNRQAESFSTYVVFFLFSTPSHMSSQAIQASDLVFHSRYGSFTSLKWTCRELFANLQYDEQPDRSRHRLFR